MGTRTLSTYDLTVVKVKQGFDYTKEKALDLINKADEAWLNRTIESIGIRDAAPETDHVYSGAFRWPLSSGNGVALTSGFGGRWGRQHKGIDLGAPVGTPVYAMASGKVLFAADSKNGFGNLVIIQHEGITTSYYAHNKVLKVATGQAVTQGAPISLVGLTGRTTGPHLHFEIREGRTAVDPCLHLPQHDSFKC